MVVNKIDSMMILINPIRIVSRESNFEARGQANTRPMITTLIRNGKVVSIMSVADCGVAMYP
jgi:hypothetical protein